MYPRTMAQSLLRACRRGVAAYAKLPLGLRRLTPRAAWVNADRLRSQTKGKTRTRGDRLISGQPYDAIARVEIAVGVLMEMCGWEPTQARSQLLQRLSASARRLKTSRRSSWASASSIRNADRCAGADLNSRNAGPPVGPQGSLEPPAVSEIQACAD